MQDPSKAFDISSTSVLDLKAELFKQKEEFEKQKVIAKNQPVSAALRKAAKKPGIWERQNKGVLERSHRDELEIVETSTLEASRAAMERKAKLYDRLSKTGITDDALAEEVLVDFDRKAWEQPSDDEPTNVKDKSEDPWNHQSLVQQYQVMIMNRYQMSYYNAGKRLLRGSWKRVTALSIMMKRRFEPIFYDLNFYEEERQEQMRALKQLRLETELKRASRQTIKEKRKAQLDARMDMIRAKRQKKSSKSESKPTQTTENTITEPHISDVTNTSNISTTDSTINKTSNKVLQLSEQAVNDLLSDIRRQIEIKKKTDS
ncbi:coiled-coil domain-containing protein 174 [Rhizophagus clarus]|uniref:Coiled-coil domain-containing protein 174 n=1 Tax=Rhizophagus clarus TaxID=94130 RepID=A0A8H3KPR7_9GLOM|nr:coiled-coil domain-containing protein 174 [Rhizophagus clarus]